MRISSTGMVEVATPPSPSLHPNGREGLSRPDTEAALKLQAWLSPAYPVGSYTYSHGLEWAVSTGLIGDRATAQDWILDCLRHGAGRTDAIFVAHAWRAAGDAAVLRELAELVTALAPSAERLLETQAQGTAFAEVTKAAWGDTGVFAPYPVALGAAAGRAAIDLNLTLALFLQAFVSNLVSAAIRLVPLGQTDGQRIVVDLSAACLDVADEATQAGLEDIGGCAVLSDIASMRHETQDVRLFRS